MYSQLYRRKLVRRAIAWVVKNRSPKAIGPDGRSTQDLAKNPQAWLDEERAICRVLRERRYFPSHVGTFTKSTGGKERTLFCLNLRDQIIETALRMLIEPLFEPGFEASSYGYRPGRSVHDALEAIQQRVQNGFTAWFRVDFEDFFYNIDTAHLRKLLADRIQDRRLLAVLSQIIEHHSMSFWKAGRFSNAKLGILLGSPLSPLFANIYLDAADKWLAQQGLFSFRFADDVLFLGKDASELESEKEGFEEYLKTEYPASCHLNRFKFALGLATDNPRDWSWTFPPQFLGQTFAYGRPVAIAGNKVLEILEKVMRKGFDPEIYEGIRRHYNGMGSDLIREQVLMLDELFIGKAESLSGLLMSSTTQALKTLQFATKPSIGRYWNTDVEKELREVARRLLVTDVSGRGEPGKEIWHPTHLLHRRGSP
ncbi:MAG: reverse transcriptase domain-containing protein [Planctomycetota bacterium]